ncbi:S-layer homology domain-containing protein [Bacillus infantis]|uniref:S-layer homology domain-containing protein n=1 Tax=Bacillus infantis TaxID=324767 RepID=UPI003CF33AE7
MKKPLIILLTFIMAISLTPAVKQAAGPTFKDLESITGGFWAREEISYLAEKGIISGYPDGTFRPNNPITRQQVAAMLVQAFELDYMNRPDPGFKDVKKGAYYYQAIATVADEGLIRGSDGRFRPSEHVTRAQMAAILSRALDFMPELEQRFLDVEKDYWAYGEINAISQNGISWGKQGNVFVPGELTTRAQFSVFLARTLNSDLRLAAWDKLISAKVSSQHQVGVWNLKYTPEAVTAVHSKTGETRSVIKRSVVQDYYIYSLESQNYQDLGGKGSIVEFDTESDIMKRGDQFYFPVVLKRGQSQPPVRAYFRITIREDIRLEGNPHPEGFISDYYDTGYFNKFNIHTSLNERYLTNVRPAGDGNVKVSLIERPLINDPLEKVTDLVIKDDRAKTGANERALRDFTSFKADGSRIFYYNSQGLYSRYYDGTQQKLLFSGKLKDFEIRGAEIYLTLLNGEKYKMSYKGENVQKIN